MTCSSCGSALNSDARFCTHCGAAVAFATAPVRPIYQPYVQNKQYNRVARHIQVLSLLWLAYAVSRFVKAVVGVLVVHGIFGMHGHSNWDFGGMPFASGWESALLPAVLVTAMISVAGAALTGYALLTRQPWARVLAIVMGIFALIHPILGTALGIYTLWVLAPAVCGVEYAAIAAQPQRA